MQKEIISLTGHEIIHFVFFKINCSLHYSLLRLVKLHQGCPCKKPENVCLGCRTLMCSSRRTLRRLSTPGHQKGRNSPAYSFIMLYLWQSIWETAKNKVYRQTWVLCKWKWPQDVFAACAWWWLSGKWEETLVAQREGDRARWRIWKMLNLSPANTKA